MGFVYSISGLHFRLWESILSKKLDKTIQYSFTQPQKKKTNYCLWPRSYKIQRVDSINYLVSLRSKILENSSNKGDPSLQLQKGAELLIQKGGRRRRARRKDKSVALNFLSFADLTGKKRQRIRTRWEIEHYEMISERNARKHDVMLSDCRYV